MLVVCHEDWAGHRFVVYFVAIDRVAFIFGPVENSARFTAGILLPAYKTELIALFCESQLVVQRTQLDKFFKFASILIVLQSSETP